MPIFNRKHCASAPACTSPTAQPECHLVLPCIPHSSTQSPIDGTGKLSSTSQQAAALRDREPRKGFEVELEVLNETIGKTELRKFRMQYTPGPGDTQIPKLEEWNGSKYVASNFKIKFYADGALYNERGEHLGAFGINQGAQQTLKSSPVIDTYGTLEQRSGNTVALSTYGNFTKTFDGEKTLIINAPPPNSVKVFEKFSRQVLEDRRDGGGLYMRAENASGYTIRWVPPAEAGKHQPQYSAAHLDSLVKTGDAKVLGKDRWQTADGLTFGKDDKGYFIERTTFLPTNMYSEKGLSYGSGRIEQQRDLKIEPPKVPAKGLDVTSPNGSTPVTPLQPSVAPKIPAVTPPTSPAPQGPKPGIVTAPPVLPGNPTPDLKAKLPVPDPVKTRETEQPPKQVTKQEPPSQPTVVVPKVDVKAKDATGGGKVAPPEQTPTTPTPKKEEAKPVQPAPIVAPLDVQALRMRELVSLMEARAVTKLINQQLRGEVLTEEQNGFIAPFVGAHPVILGQQIDQLLEQPMRLRGAVPTKIGVADSNLYTASLQAITDERLKLTKVDSPNSPLKATADICNRLSGDIQQFRAVHAGDLPPGLVVGPDQLTAMKRLGLIPQNQTVGDFRSYLQFLESVDAKQPPKMQPQKPNGNGPTGQPSPNG
jgi:hypothetical protein